MGHDYDVQAEAERVAASAAERVGLPRDTFYPFETLYTVRRALLLATLFPRATTPVVGWIARIEGTDRTFGLARAFLPKCWRVLRDADAPPARDCTTVRVGDILEVHREEGANRHGRRFTKKFLRVTGITDAGLSAVTLGEEEVAALYHGQVRP